LQSFQPAFSKPKKIVINQLVKCFGSTHHLNTTLITFGSLMQGKNLTLTIVLLSYFLIWQSAVNAAPEAKLIPFWQASNEANTAIIEHQAWQTILDNYLIACREGASCFDYAKLLKNKTDKEKLADYLSYLQNLDPRHYSKAEQKAYWINLYNALTVHIILDNYPVKSITKIHQGLFSFGPWDDVHAKVAEQDLTLNNIEHGILRPIWQDNRIHYAVNCASYGCPNLAFQAYTASNMDALLKAGAKAYVNHPRGVEFQDNGNRLVISKIYEWYQSDFGNTEKSVIDHLITYADSGLADRLEKYQGTIDYEYDWNLNQP